VIPCKQCGTALPDQARFCPHCGAPVESPVELEPVEHPPLPEPPVQPQGPPPALDFVQPALAGGMFLGVLSTLPFISAANCICCMWVLLGGGIGSFLLAKQRPAGITYGDGAFVGVLSGLFGSIIGTAIHIPMQMISLRLFGSQPEQLENLLRQFGVQEGPMRDWMMRIFSGEISAATILFTFFSYLLMWSLFAMIGGILTVAILNKRVQPQKST
jgi:hypothetical protein